MKMTRFLFAAFFALSSFTFAQDKLLTIDDIFSPDPAVKVAFSGAPPQVRWAPDGMSFKEVRAGRLMRVNATTGDAVPYFDNLKLETALAANGFAARDVGRLANSVNLQFNGAETAILFDQKDDLWWYNVTTGVLKRLTNNKEDELEAAFSPDGRYVSFVRGNNLFVVDVTKGGEKQLTRDGGEKIYNGYLDWVYEEEVYGRGNKRGYWWSPDSRHIAFLRLDETPVPKFVLPNDIPTDQDVEDTHYPQAGDPNPLVQLGIADVEKNLLIPNPARIPRVGSRLPASIRRLGDAVSFADLKAYKPDNLLIVRVTWSPDGRAVIFQAQDREQTVLDLNAAGLDGKVTKLFAETSPAWVGVNDDPMFLGDGSAIWQSERDGWNHLYHYGVDGRLIKRLTSGKWEVRGVYGVDPAGEWIYFSGTKDSHIAENVYRVRISDGTIERLSKGGGWHGASFNRSFTHYIEAWSDASTPTQLRLFKSDGTLVRVISENKVEALSQYRLTRPDFLTVRTRDGFEMEAMMIKPPNFDSTKKYPVLIYNYSGPHAPQVADRWAGSRYMWHQMLAQKGYIVWTCDNRTASGKGLESTWGVYKNFGESELRDIEEGISYLKSLPFVDGGRIGMWGWSYGGFMTSYAMTHSKSFKMGMAGGIVSDWRLYDSIYTERYMLTPDRNREGYDKSSVSKAAKDLHGRLLLMHGMMDDNVHMQNMTQFAYELQKAGKQFDMMIYPTQRHGVTNPAQVKHLYEMMTEYVLRNL